MMPNVQWAGRMLVAPIDVAFVLSKQRFRAHADASVSNFTYVPRTSFVDWDRATFDVTVHFLTCFSKPMPDQHDGSRFFHWAGSLYWLDVLPTGEQAIFRLPYQPPAT